MNLTTINQLAGYARVSGEAIEALIRDQPAVISTHGFLEYMAVLNKFHSAMAEDSEFCNHPEFRKFDEKRRIALRCLQEEQG